MYSILADMTPDITYWDILEICVRFVSNNGKVKERLLQTNQSMDKNGLRIAKKWIKSKLHRFTIS